MLRGIKYMFKDGYYIWFYSEPSKEVIKDLAKKHGRCVQKIIF